MKVIYKTRDNKEFEDKDLAEKHEATLIDLEKVKKEAQELLSQLAIVLKDIPEVKQSRDSDDYRPIMGTAVLDEDGNTKRDENYDIITVESKEEIELASLKRIIGILKAQKIQGTFYQNITIQPVIKE